MAPPVRERNFPCTCFSKGCRRSQGGVTYWKDVKTPRRHRHRDILINRAGRFPPEHAVIGEQTEGDLSQGLEELQLPDDDHMRDEAREEEPEEPEIDEGDPHSELLQELGIEPGHSFNPALLARLSELLAYGNENDFSNNNFDWILKWNFGREESVAAALDPEWRQKNEDSSAPVPDSFAKLIGLVHGAGEKLGAPEEWKLRVEEDRSWHLFPPLEAPLEPCPLCPPDSRPKRTQEECEEHRIRCRFCNVARKDCHDLLWIGHEPHLKASMSTEAGCRSLLGAWSQKERWRGKGLKEAPAEQHEVWDGEVFREHAAFFDPERSFSLPLACDRCCAPRAVYCSRHLELPSFALVEECSEEGDEYVAVCETCGEEMRASKKDVMVRGSPRNVAVMPHYDSFQIGSTTPRPAAVLNFQPVTVFKEERFHLRENWVCPLAFPPVELLGTGPDFLDPVMLILVLEYVRLFTKGFLVDYALPSKEVDARLPKKKGGSPERVRVILLAVVADYPGLAEMVKFSLGGYNASRRCQERGVLDEVLRKVFYDAARENARYPCEPKTLQNFLDAEKRHRYAETFTERKRLGTETGVTGVCLLNVLRKVSRYNPTRMTLSDQMHRGALNTVKNWISDTLMLPGGEWANRKFDIDERDPMEGPVVEMDDFSERLSRIWPTRELKSGRFPKDPEQRKVAWWKAEEYEKYARVCGEVVYAGCIDAEGFAVTTLVCKVEQVVELAHRHGWSKELQQLFEALCLAMFVRAEEYLGTKERPLAHDIGRHCLEDIRTHGSLTAFWVYAQERYIRHLVRIPTNGRHIEKTFAKREFAALTSRCLNRRHQEAELKAKGLNGADAAWTLARKEFQGVVFVSGQDSAAELTRVLPVSPPSSSTTKDAAILESVKSDGVVVGSLPSNWRLSSYELLRGAQLERVRAIVRRLGGSDLAHGRKGPARVMMKSLTKGRSNFAVSDFVILSGSGGKGTERFGRIESVYVVRDEEGLTWPLVDCSFFEVPLDEQGRRMGAPWHNLLQLGALREPGGDRACAGRELLRHFIPYPEEGYTPAFSPSNVAIEVKPDSLGFSASDVKIPLHVQVGDIVRVASESNSMEAAEEDNTWTSETPVPATCILKTVGPGQAVEHALVVETDAEDKMAVLVYLKKVSGGPDEEQCWKLWRGYDQFEMGWDDILDRVEVVREEGNGGLASRRFFFRPSPPVLRLQQLDQD